MNDYHLRSEMKAAGLSVGELAQLTGHNRCSISRWRRPGAAVPNYVRTIVRQRQRISQLLDAVGAGMAPSSAARRAAGSRAGARDTLKARC